MRERTKRYFRYLVFYHSFLQSSPPHPQQKLILFIAYLKGWAWASWHWCLVHDWDNCGEKQHWVQATCKSNIILIIICKCIPELFTSATANIQCLLHLQLRKILKDGWLVGYYYFFPRFCLDPVNCIMQAAVWKMLDWIRLAVSVRLPYGFSHLQSYLNDFQIKLRGFLSHIQQLRISYWGPSAVKSQSMSAHALPSPRPKDGSDQNQQPAEPSVVGRSWVQSMFSRDTSARINSLSRSGRWSTDGGCFICSFYQYFGLIWAVQSKILCCLFVLLSSATSESGTPQRQDLSSAAQKKVQSNIRVLRGHSGAVTALHCVTKREVWDLVGDREDAGFFISGSTDCSVKSCIFHFSHLWENHLD